jgi:hypothetical protein
MGRYTKIIGVIIVSTGGSVVEFSPATRETGVRFPANATFFSYNGHFNSKLNVTSTSPKWQAKRPIHTENQAEIKPARKVPRPGIEPGTFRSSV